MHSFPTTLPVAPLIHPVEVIPAFAKLEPYRAEPCDVIREAMDEKENPSKWNFRICGIFVILKLNHSFHLLALYQYFDRVLNWELVLFKPEYLWVLISIQILFNVLPFVLVPPQILRLFLTH